jgi:hypothetical protein
VMQYALNDAANSATGVTPNLAVFGTERKGGWDIPVDEGTPKHEKMKIFHRQISAELEWTRAQAKRYYDKKRVEAPSLKKGDKVYIYEGEPWDKESLTSKRKGSLCCLPFTLRLRPLLDFYPSSSLISAFLLVLSL